MHAQQIITKGNLSDRIYIALGAAERNWTGKQRRTNPNKSIICGEQSGTK